MTRMSLRNASPETARLPLASETLVAAAGPASSSVADRISSSGSRRRAARRGSGCRGGAIAHPRRRGARVARGRRVTAGRWGSRSRVPGSGAVRRGPAGRGRSGGWAGGGGHEPSPEIERKMSEIQASGTGRGDFRVHTRRARAARCRRAHATPASSGGRTPRGSRPWASDARRGPSRGRATSSVRVSASAGLGHVVALAAEDEQREAPRPLRSDFPGRFRTCTGFESRRCPL